MIKSQLIIFTSKYAYPPGTLVICVLKEGHLSQFPFFASHIQWMAESWSFCLFNISLSSPLLHSWHFSGHHHPRIWWLRPKHDFSLSSSDLNLVHLCIVHLYMGNSGEAIPTPRFRGMFGQSSGNYIYIPYPSNWIRNLAFHILRQKTESRACDSFCQRDARRLFLGYRTDDINPGLISRCEGSQPENEA